jgi:coenzyme F420 hydrogenase subunit beta
MGAGEDNIPVRFSCPMHMDGPGRGNILFGFQRLKVEVIEKGLCTRCGGCVAVCPVRCIDHTGEGIVLRGDCIGCGLCSSICPGAVIDITAHERRLFGSAHGKRRTDGIVTERHDLIASDEEVFRRGYFGGRVSALLISLLDAGWIDAALLTDFNREGGTLSVGSARISRNRDDVLSLAGSKYLFSPVLSLLRDVEADPSIKRAAIVCLPCHAHAFRNIEFDPRTSHLARKISLVIGLNCGAVNLDEDGWRKVVGKLSGLDPEKLSSVDIRKVSSRDLRLSARSDDGEEADKVMAFSKYSSSVLRQGIWDRCRMCTDYPCYLSDLTFGSPIVRNERGAEALDIAIRAGGFRRSSFKRRTVQRVLDGAWGRWKPFRARRTISRRRRIGLPGPEYR